MALLKIPFTLVLIMVLAKFGTSEPYQPQEHIWKHRVILLFAPNAVHPDYQRVTDELDAAATAVAERHLVVFPVFVDNKGSKQTREQFSADAERFTFVLIGKDGGEKLRTHDPNLDEVFGLIDSMPMRQREMKAPSE